MLILENIFVEDPKIIAVVDIDMFFAAVVIRDDPKLINKPLIIGNPNARISRRGVVLTCSYEAREYGVRSGMPMVEALKKCPVALIRRSNYEANKKSSKNIMEYLKSLNIPVRVASIDEAYLDLTDMCETMEAAFTFAKEIQRWIFDNEKLTVSIGIGPTKIIAKMASDYNKPNAVTAVKLSGLEAFFYNLKLSKIPGIGKVMFSKLQSNGFTKCGQLFNMDLKQMRLNVGSIADFLYDVFNANTSTDLTTRGSRKSISHETTFHGVPLDIPTYLSKLDYVFNRTYDELNKKELIVKTVSIKVRFNDFKTITRSKTLLNHSNDRLKLYEAMILLIEPYLEHKLGIRLLGVKFSNIISIEKEQTTLHDFFN